MKNPTDNINMMADYNYSRNTKWPNFELMALYKYKRQMNSLNLKHSDHML